MNKPASPLDPGPTPSGSRYEMLATIASGGMATVYVGRMRGAGGFSRMVAVKRAHPHLLADPTYRTMLVDEARLAARLHHPNVVAVLDVEELDGELSLVMDYVEGASLYDLIEASHAAGRPLPPRIAVRVALDACEGLHAAHTLLDEQGRPLGLVHRDVSPQNILVGIEGVARLSDFGVAKHAEGVATTTGVLKGKLSYMAPEYLESTRLDARSDVFSLGVVVWESLAGQKLFRGKSELETFKKVVATVVPPLSSVVPWANERLDAILFAALARAPEHRFQSAEEFGIALEAEARYDDLIATPTEVGACVRELFGDALAERRADMRRISAPPQITRERISSTSAVRREAATVVARAPTPVPEEVTAEVSRLQQRASRPADPPQAPEPSRPSGPQQKPQRPADSFQAGGHPQAPEPLPPSGLQQKPQRPADPEPLRPSAGDPEVRSPRSSGALWKGALILGTVVAIGGAVAFMATRSGGDARSPIAPSSTASAVAAAVAPSVPPPITSAAAPTAHPSSISVSDLPNAAPTSSGRLRGRMHNKKGAPAPESYPVSTGVPLSAWTPAPPPPAPAPEAPQPEP